MARLTYAEKKRLPDSAFALPRKRKYVIKDAAHARDALSRVSAFGSPHEKRVVREMVHKRFPSIDVHGLPKRTHSRKRGSKR